MNLNIKNIKKEMLQMNDTSVQVEELNEVKGKDSIKELINNTRKILDRIKESLKEQGVTKLTVTPINNNDDNDESVMRVLAYINFTMRVYKGMKDGNPILQNCRVNGSRFMENTKTKTKFLQMSGYNTSSGQRVNNVDFFTKEQKSLIEDICQYHIDIQG